MTGEFDVYYDAIYRGTFPVRKNISWCSGVPLLGISTSRYYEATGYYGKHQMKLRAIMAEGISSKKVGICLPIAEPRSTDTPSPFIKGEEDTEVLIGNIKPQVYPAPGYNPLDAFLGDLRAVNTADWKEILNQLRSMNPTQIQEEEMKTQLI